MVFLLHLFFCSVTTVFVYVHGQVQTGYISIDCGSRENFNYVDDTGISYSSDESFVSTGVNKNISSEYAYPINPILPLPLSDLRSFPQGNKNCYILRPNGGKRSLNLIRATFMYGNYDGENKLPEFDLYLGVNLWLSVKFINASEVVTTEIIDVASADTLSVCLVNSGHGIPFISALELRPLDGSIYKIDSSIWGSLVLFQRLDTGYSNGSGRYADDIYDRIWSSYTLPSWDSLHTSSEIDISGNGYRAPSEVMQTAATPKIGTGSLEFSWNTSDSKAQFYIYMYFADLFVSGRNQSREFNVSWNGTPLFGNVKPRAYYASTLNNLRPLVGKEHKISIQRSGSANLPPILNAIEIYRVQEFSEFATFNGDVDAIADIRTTYKVNKNWVGDPCGPKNYSWEGVACNYTNISPPRIISLNLSTNDLSGQIAASIANFSSLEALDLSNNSLTGTIPEFLEKLSLLKFLDLRGNLLSGPVPRSLMERSRNGLLTLRVDDSILCDSGSCQNKKKKVVAPIVASLLSSLVLLLLLIIIWRVRRKGKTGKAKSNEEGRALESNNRQFTYAEVVNMTDNFQTIIGKGGFGTVYLGRLENGSQVAVKLLSASSWQGYKEFQNEAELLMRVHHRNLASFVGYCHDENKMALVYEYMANGNLKNYILARSDHPLSWELRLNIAIDAAQGLEYLHHGCRPAIIHRDVKSANILLNENLNAKIADFGLSMGLPDDQTTHILTDVFGTTGYLDPEYRRSHNLNEKSDVYSFGIVLLELITGQPVIIKCMDYVHIMQYVGPYLEKGEITTIVDEQMGGDFNLDSVWKAIEVAVACTRAKSTERVTMSEVLIRLKVCLEMELARGGRNPTNHMNVKTASLRIDYSPDVCSMDLDLMTGPSARW
ncbi:probable LRR receptor-like serine/threonine-protein kinase At4g29180 [Cynara cardunculus var. scolymus]|uniref:probable LRR receptor-like serine/threonine-protein kinase At4g29180 n=1 Tax=Cynara cardunculus var. scolymus TaxID=59895 RepID=UPI000D62301D|nr:probable LRR receptor-like serine/threonine-protein kinase At4g29180 [Cynara cardunculus var. scolymus]